MREIILMMDNGTALIKSLEAINKLQADNAQELESINKLIEEIKSALEILGYVLDKDRLDSLECKEAIKRINEAINTYEIQ